MLLRDSNFLIHWSWRDNNIATALSGWLRDWAAGRGVNRKQLHVYTIHSKFYPSFLPPSPLSPSKAKVQQQLEILPHWDGRGGGLHLWCPQGDSKETKSACFCRWQGERGYVMLKNTRMSYLQRRDKAKVKGKYYMTIRANLYNLVQIHTTQDKDKWWWFLWMYIFASRRRPTANPPRPVP